MGRPCLLSAIMLALTTIVIPGCILGNRPDFVYTGRDRDEVTFYLDGAGNLGFGKETVPLGLADAGYDGRVEHFIWTTYLGPIHDQVGLNHNRRKAGELAFRIERYLDAHPKGKVNIIALSAGTGVAVFALEGMGYGYAVENVVMLSSSLSADYDLSRALKSVRGGMYFFWSSSDPILNGVVPLLGTVDRSAETIMAAGNVGARVPLNASAEVKACYRERVHNIEWQPQPLIGPVKLRHAGSIDRTVIRDLVAPIIVGKPRDRLAGPMRVASGDRHGTSQPVRPSGEERTPSSTRSHPAPATSASSISRDAAP